MLQLELFDLVETDLPDGSEYREGDDGNSEETQREDEDQQSVLSEVQEVAVACHLVVALLVEAAVVAGMRLSRAERVIGRGYVRVVPVDAQVAAALSKTSESFTAANGSVLYLICADRCVASQRAAC